uniref:Uncharacterized protein n=1 Tax=Anguilla anguilla TaxID=7936 RepID=A0A0E9XWU0_ANGAN
MSVKLLIVSHRSHCEGHRCSQAVRTPGVCVEAGLASGPSLQTMESSLTDSKLKLAISTG